MVLDSGKAANEGLRGGEKVGGWGGGQGLRRSRERGVAVLTWLQLPGNALYLTAKDVMASTSAFCQLTFTAILPAARRKDTLSGGPHRTEGPTLPITKQNSPKENSFY